jgi:hypothetical protein
MSSHSAAALVDVVLQDVLQFEGNHPLVNDLTLLAICVPFSTRLVCAPQRRVGMPGTERVQPAGEVVPRMNT